MSTATKRVLAASFKKLLCSRPLSKVTVKDIVEDAQVNRQTFYYHFRDIRDMIRWIFDGEARTVSALGDDPLDWHAYFLNTLTAMTQERTLVMNAFHSLSREDLEQYLSSVIEPIVCGRMEEIGEGLAIPDDDRRFIADFFRHAFTGLLLDWIRKGMREEPELLVNQTMHMLEVELRHCLEEFSAQAEGPR